MVVLYHKLILCEENVEAKEENLAEEVEDVSNTHNNDAEEAETVERNINANDLEKDSAGIVEVKINKMNDIKKDSAEIVEVKVKDVEDELCPDEQYKSQPKEFTSVQTQTLECGGNPMTTSKSALDFYTLTYDDYDSED